MSPLLLSSEGRAEVRDVHRQPSALHGAEDAEQEVGRRGVHSRHHGQLQQGAGERIQTHEDAELIQTRLLIFKLLSDIITSCFCPSFSVPPTTPTSRDMEVARYSLLAT